MICSMFFPELLVGEVLFLTPLFLLVNFSWSLLLWRSRWLRSVRRSYIAAFARAYNIIWWGYNDLCSMYWQGSHFSCWSGWPHIWGSLFNWLWMAKTLPENLHHCWFWKCNFEVLFLVIFYLQVIDIHAWLQNDFLQSLIVYAIF